MALDSAHTVQYIELGSFTLLAGVCLVRSITRRDIALGWLSAAFSALAAPIALGMVLQNKYVYPHLPPMWLVHLFIGVIMTFPYFLYRFMLCFERPPLPQRALVVGGAVVGLSVMLFADPVAMQRAKQVIPGMTIYALVMMADFLFATVLVAWHLWRAGRPLPSPARKRANLLAGGSAVFGLALVVAVSFSEANQKPGSAAALTTAWLVTVSAWLFLVGVMPPTALVRRWRRHEEAEFREDLVDIAFAGASAIQLRSTMMPKLAELMGATRVDWYRPDGLLLATSGGNGRGTRPMRIGLPDAGYLVVRTTAFTPFFANEITALSRTLGSMLRLTVERALSEEAASIAKRDLEEAQRIAHIGNWTWDLENGELVWSDEMFRLHGLEPGPAAPPLEDYRQIIEPDDLALVDELIRAAFESTQAYDAEYRVRTIAGGTRWLQVKGRVTSNAMGEAIALFGTCQDVTERHEMQVRLTRQALHDDLTGLPNRTLLTDRLTVALNGQRHNPTAVLFIDVDRFKVINDSLGHEAGDAVLVELSRRIQLTVRPSDTVARFGGDELVVLCPDVRDRAHALEIADRIASATAAPIMWQGKPLTVSISTGVALSTVTGLDPSHLLRDADAAMYVAKQAGRSRAVFFEGNIRTEAVERLDIESALWHAITREELELHYQPLMNLDTGRIIGFEALMRWQHPERGLLAPDQFLTVAEETGLIVPMGAWAVDQACGQLREWLTRFPELGELRMAVNVSVQQIADPDFAEVIAAAIEKYGLAPGQLELEITERVFADDSQQTYRTMAALEGLGARLAVDDFGVGYSSLAYLKRFPVHTLKIDRSFVMGIARDSDDAAIVRAILALAEELGLVTLAEGIEEQAQWRTLSAMGCNEGQGYLFSRPKDAASIGSLLASHAGGWLGVSA